MRAHRGTCAQLATTNIGLHKRLFTTAALVACNSRMALESRIHANTTDTPTEKELAKAIDDCTLTQLKASRANDVKYLAHLNLSMVQ